MTGELSEDLTAYGVDQVHKFLDEISAEIGPPVQPIGNICLSVLRDGPALSFTDDGSATVFLGPHALNYRPTLLANLAHESVHLHEATAGYASGLEEGFATAFELKKISEAFGTQEQEHFLAHLPASYARALRDYHQLVALGSDSIGRFRNIRGRLTGPSFKQVYRAFPELGLLRSFRLAHCRRMR